MASFSQRHGYESAKKAFQREEVSRELRISLWNVLKIHVWDKWQDYSLHSMYDSKQVDLLVGRYWVKSSRDLDKLPPFYADSGSGAYNLLKDEFLTCEWYKVFDFMEFVAEDRTKLLSSEAVSVINSVLEKENSAYRFVATKIAEITDAGQIAAIENALATPSDPVRTHLESALALLSDKSRPDYRNSIKESVSAVEAMCCQLANKPKATLADALKLLPKLHPALKQALSNLYGYTSDEGGIRHKLQEESSLNKTDATFMLVVCAAFINYLQETITQ